MSGADVASGVLPLTRLNPWYPGQMGVPGTDTETGLRLSATGAIFYVDPNYPGASDQRDGTNPTDPLRTIQAAVDRCESYRNDVIIVGMNAGYGDSPGTPYPIPIVESVLLNKHGVRLMGVSPSSFGVVWFPATAATFCLTVTGCDCAVEGFGFAAGMGGGDGIYGEWGGGAFGDNLTIRHCLFHGTVDTAIQLEFVWYADIHHNAFWNCSEFGVFVNPMGSGIAYGRIHNNEFYTGAAMHALDLQGATECIISDNRLFNADAAAGAASTDEGIVTTGGRANMVCNNWLSCLLPAGAPGDYDDFCTSSPTDAWLNNHLTNGDSVTNPT